jgi:monoamine oxidase
MAKTPLLDWLQRESCQMNRRVFLQTAAITGLGLTGLGALALPGLERRGPKVIVVGAGLAGLSAAYRLRQAGLHPLLLEASNRTGGRVSTERRSLGAGLIAERGGEWIEPGHPSIQGLAADLGVDLEAVPAGEPPQVWMGGEPYATPAIRVDLAALAPALQRDWQALGGQLPSYRSASPAAKALDQLSSLAWIERNVVGGARSRLGRLLAAALAVEWGAEAEHLSAIHLVAALAGGALASGASPGGASTGPTHSGLPGGASAYASLPVLSQGQTRYRVEGGNDRLTEALQDRLGSAILYQTRLTALYRAGDGTYRLDVAGPNGTRTLRADQVILALPLPVLRDAVDLGRAGFSTAKLAALQGLGVGIKGKLHLTASGPATFHDDGWGATAPGRPGLMVHWLGGEAGRRLTWGTPGERSRYLLDHLATLESMPAGPWQGRSILDDWSNWSPAGGATAYRPPGHFTAHAGREAEPEGCCHFAGEWTSERALGRMEGAVESGERAARAVIAQLSSTHTKEGGA